MVGDMPDYRKISVIKKVAGQQKIRTGFPCEIAPASPAILILKIDIMSRTLKTQQQQQQNDVYNT
jgi:hypothetical protein